MMSGWKKQDRGQKERDAKRNYGMLSDLDQYTDYAWHEGILPFMATSAAGMLENASIRELINNPVYREIFAAMMDPPITKPAMNHRLKKLIEMAKEADK